MIPTKFNKLQFQNNKNYSVDWKDFLVVSPMRGYIFINSNNVKKYEKFKIKTRFLEYAKNFSQIQNIEYNNQQSFSQAFNQFQSNFFISNAYGYKNLDYFDGDTYEYMSQNNEIINGFQKSDNDTLIVLNGSIFYFLPNYINYGGHGALQIMLIDPNNNEYKTNSYIIWQCLTQDAMIMLIDGSQKMLKYIQVGDRIMGINPCSGEYQQDQVTIVSKYQDVYSESCDIWYFENGTIIKTPKQHRFFNIKLQKFEYLNNWNIGDQIRLYDGSSSKLIKHQIKYEKTKCYTLFSKFNSYIANKCICGNRFSKSITPFDK